MNTSVPNGRTPAYYTVREAAWVLGVQPATIWRAIRLGTLPTVRRRSRLVIPAHVVARLLPPAMETGGDAR